MIKKIKKLIENIFLSLGYKIIPLNYREKLIDEEFSAIYDKCKEYTMTSIERMYALHKAVKYIVEAKIPGDFVECGVWRGGSSMVIAYTLLEMKVTDRKIWLYDTFTGMSQPGDEDIDYNNNTSAIDTWEKTQKEDFSEWCLATINDVQKNMDLTGYPENNLVFVKGKVEDTIPRQIPQNIALLRLDTDWYESTKHELDFLYPLVSSKGILILDDYGSWAGSKKATDEYFSGKALLFNRIDPTGRLIIKTE